MQENRIVGETVTTTKGLLAYVYEDLPADRVITDSLPPEIEEWLETIKDNHSPTSLNP